MGLTKRAASAIRSATVIPRMVRCVVVMLVFPLVWLPVELSYRAVRRRGGSSLVCSDLQCDHDPAVRDLGNVVDLLHKIRVGRLEQALAARLTGRENAAQVAH